MVTFTKCQGFVGALGLGLVNLNTDAIKIGLTNTALTATGIDVKANITEVANGNGYTTGGIDIGNLFSETGGVGRVTATGDPSWTATGGSIGPFRYAFAYDDTVATAGHIDKVLGFWDYGTAVTLTSGESFVVDLTTTSAFTLT